MRTLLLLVALSACAMDLGVGAAEPPAPPKRNRNRPEVQPITIPADLVGMTLRDAMDRLRAIGHRGAVADEHGKCQQPAEPDRVCGSRPAIGTAVDPGSFIVLHLSPR